MLKNIDKANLQIRSVLVGEFARVYIQRFPENPTSGMQMDQDHQYRPVLADWLDAAEPLIFG